MVLGKSFFMLKTPFYDAVLSCQAINAQTQLLLFSDKYRFLGPCRFITALIISGIEHACPGLGWLTGSFLLDTSKGYHAG
jgi:hypothetical protein